MKPQALIPTTAAHLKKAAQPGSFVAKLFGVLKGGASLAQSVAAQLAAFMAVPAQAAVDAAMKMAQALGQSGIPMLTPEQRLSVGSQVVDSALSLTPETANALAQAPSVETATGVSGQVLQQQIQQEEELISLARVLGLAQGAVGDARLVVQGWQFEAQRRLVPQIFLAFTTAPSVQERLQVVADAGPALDALEKQLNDLRATVAANAGASAELQAELLQANNDLQMVQTMRDVRDGKPVDDALLQQMAAYYEERVGAAQAPAPTATTAKKPKAKGTKSGTKTGKTTKKTTKGKKATATAGQ